MKLELNGRRILVTGASGDIGAAIARKLAASGAHLILHYNSSAERAQRLSRETCFAAQGATLVQADLTDEAACDTLFSGLAGNGGITDLVCNAGYLVEKSTPLQDMPLEQWNRTLTMNLTATFLTLRGYFRQLAQTACPDPAVVIVGSMSGVWGQPGHSDYASAKAAMTSGLLPSLKDEIVRIAPQGRVNLVAPGFVRTRMIAGKLADTLSMKKVLQTASLRKFATPEDVANSVSFLISPAQSGHITGEVIRLVGGKEGRVLFDLDEIEF